MVRKYIKRPKRIPKLQHHKASGKGVVRLNGKDFYCGEYGTGYLETVLYEIDGYIPSA